MSYQKYLELCTEDQIDDFYAEFGATRETMHRDVQYLKEWLEKQPHLPNVKDDKWLTNFLLRCKNSVEKTKKRLHIYFTTKALYPDVFQNSNMKQTFNDLSTFAFVPMPKLTPNGYRVIVCYFYEYKASDLPPGEKIISGMQAIFDYSLMVDQVRGLTLIYDGKNLSMALMATILQIINKFLLLQKKMNPLRYDKIYFLNLPSFGLPLVNIACSLIKKDTEKFVICKKEPSKLAEVLPTYCLPKEYGGSQFSIPELHRMYSIELSTCQEKFRELDSMIADLSKKPGKIEEISTHGVNGTFRQLNID